MHKLHLKLYITGHTSKSQRALANLRKIFHALLDIDYELTIVDVLENPELADEEHILATPTLIKVLPLPSRRLIGDLSDTERVLMELELSNVQKRSD
jgi:circadian clock protein KaiB